MLMQFLKFYAVFVDGFSRIFTRNYVANVAYVANVVIWGVPVVYEHKICRTTQMNHYNRINTLDNTPKNTTTHQTQGNATNTTFWRAKE